MVKLGISMGAATLIAVLILIGGSLSDVRMWVVLTRCMTGFFVVGATVYLTTYLLEYFNVIGFDKSIKQESADDETEGETENDEQAAGENQDGVGDDSSRFTPLVDSILDRVRR